MRTPDFERNLLRVLHREKPDRATLFELFFSQDYYARLAGHKAEADTADARMLLAAEGMAAAGYDYATYQAEGFAFPIKAHDHRKTVSLNYDPMIHDWESFEKYPWPDATRCDYDLLDRIVPRLPEGQKFMAMGPCGVLENVIRITGYENLCIMLYEDPDLVQAVFDGVGRSLLTYYEHVVQADVIGFLCSNDDWGFNTQTFLSPADMRKYVFPWHKKIVETAHRYGKPCILHSCGCFRDVIDDVIDDIRFDARHSYEDNIMSVEDAYEAYHDRIAILGGMDMNLLTGGTPEAITARAQAMLERVAGRGGYALGSGNSIPDYVPYENFRAMIAPALA